MEWSGLGENTKEKGLRKWILKERLCGCLLDKSIGLQVYLAKHAEKSHHRRYVGRVALPYIGKS